FVDPENTRCQAFCDAEYFLYSLFGFSNVLVEDSCSVELHQWKFPLPGNSSGAHAFAAALNSEDDGSAWWLQAEVASSVFPRAAPLGQPVLEIIQTTYTGQVFRGVDKFQHSRMT